MALAPRPALKPSRLRHVGRQSYVDIADKRCRLRTRGCPRLLEKLLMRLSQARHLYLLNMWERGSRVCRSHMGRTFRVFRGQRWRVVTPSAWHLSFSWGAFARTRHVAAFKARAATKKRKRVPKGVQVVGEMKILQFRALQLGHKRRTSTRTSLDLEARMRSAGP